MKISHQWLQTLIPIRLAPDKLADGLSMLGLEVERYEDLAAKLNGFVVGEVLSREKHPNANKLTVCRVSVGKEEIQVVCGAPNVAAGQKVPVGLAGATVPRNQHDPDGKPFVLSRTTIRGVESQGMICSEYELDLGTDKDGIMVLDPSAKTGTPLAKVLGTVDVVYDIEITANRGDWLSHAGVAREIAAMTGKRMTLPKTPVRESRTQAGKEAAIRIDDAGGCPRYIARVLRNVAAGPSPDWLKERLLSVGVRPVNTIVDVTNFVMFETGQPLHAFDYDKLAGATIIVRGSKEGEKFVTLDGKERTLRAGTLMICDAEKPVAIAGVMGGMNSEISDSTVNVLIESACFDATAIRRTARYLGLSTEASQRFERSVDIEMTLYAANRAASLLQQLTGAEVLKGVVDKYPKRRKFHEVKLRISRANALLGTTISKAAAGSYLKRLGLSVRSVSADALAVTIPPYRNDLLEEVDLIEEIARMYGYNNIDTETSGRISFNVQSSVDPERQMRDLLAGAGFNEIVTNSLQNKEHAALTGETTVSVLNPVSIDMQMLRASLIPGALDVIQHNQNRGTNGLRLFEFGKVYRKDGADSAETLEAYGEEQRLLIALTGDHFNQHYSVPARKYDLLDLKGEVQSLLDKFFLDKYRLIYYDNDKPLSVDNLHIEIQGTYAGFLGRLRKEITARFGIDEEVFVAELSMEILSSFWRQERRFQALPRFPGVRRDLAFVVGAEVPQGNVEEAIRQSGGELLKSIVLFDLYSGEQLGAGKKGLAYALEFQPADRTLTDEEANEVISRIVRHVQQACGAVLRA